MLKVNDYNEREVLSPKEFFNAAGISGLTKEVSHIRKYILTFKYMKAFLSRCEFHNMRQIQWYNNLNLFNLNGEDIGLLVSLTGAPAITTSLEELIAFGGKYFILVGGVGVLDEKIKRGDVIIPLSAIRDEGVSYHYIPENIPSKPSNFLRNLIDEECRSKNIPFFEGLTWTTDAPYRETPSRIRYAKNKGAISVEMEASACFAVAQFRKVELAAIFYGGDLVREAGWNFRKGDLEKSNKAQEVLFDVIRSIFSHLD